MVDTVQSNSVITGFVVSQWLVDVKIPPPWRDEDLSVAARNLETLRQQLPNWQARQAARMPFHRVQKAIDELRNALQTFVPTLEKEAADQQQLCLPASYIDEFQRSIDVIRIMQTSLIDLPRPSKQINIVKFCAVSAFQALRLIHPNIKVSRETGSPSYLFVERALRAMGSSVPSGSSMERYLRDGHER